MLGEAVFIRTDTPNGVQFDVTPAPKPAGASTLLTVGLGCRGLLGGVVFGILAAIPTFYIVGMILGRGMATLASLAVACGIAVWSALRTVRKYRPLNPESGPTRLVVNSTGIQHPAGFVKTDDIAELILRHPFDQGGYRVSKSVSSPAYDAGQRIGVGMMNRSFALMARRKSISTPEIIVQGLTWNVGEALLNDVREAMV